VVYYNVISVLAPARIDPMTMQLAIIASPLSTRH